MKSIAKKIFYSLSFLTILLLGSCEKDFDTIEQTQSIESSQLPFKKEVLPLESIPEIKNYVTTFFNSKKNDYTKKRNGNSHLIFNTDSIRSAISRNDSIKNYSISFSYDDAPENVFYNLLVSVLPNGQLQGRQLQFICDPTSFNNFKSHGFDFNYFQGITNMTNIKLNGGSFTNRDGDDDECPPIVVPSNTTSGNAGGGGGGGSVSTQGSPNNGSTTGVPGYGSTTVVGYNATSSYSGTLSVTIGGVTFYSGYSAGPSSSTGDGGGGTGHNDCYGSGGQYWHRGDPLIAPHPHNGKSNCQENTFPDGYVPINMAVLRLQHIVSILNLTTDEIDWLQDKPNDIFKIYTFLINNGSQHTINFLEESIRKMKAEPTVYNSITPFLIEEKIDDTLLDPCAKSVLNILKNTNNLDLTKILAKLNASGSPYKTKIIRLPTNPGVYNGKVIDFNSSAITIPATTTSKFDYLIFVNPNNTDRTKLYIANVLVHELIHAYFMSIVDDYRTNATSSPSYYNINSLPAVFQAYCDFVYPGPRGVMESAHHNDIANLYIDTIARATQEFNTGVAVPVGTQPNQIYSDLAWAGLLGTPVFDATHPVGSSSRERVKDRIRAEQSGHDVNQGTPEQQSVVGQPCN